MPRKVLKKLLSLGLFGSRLKSPAMMTVSVVAKRSIRRAISVRAGRGA